MMARLLFNRRWAVAIAVVGCAVLPSQFVPAAQAAQGAPYLHGDYWPNWAYSPLAELPVKNCTSYDVSDGVATWNATGLVSIGTPSSTTDCDSDGYLNIQYGVIPCAGCEGQVINLHIPRQVKNPETGAVGMGQTYRSYMYLNDGLGHLGPSTAAHELGHVIGLEDQYNLDSDGNPVCANGTDPPGPNPSLMDFCHIPTPQSGDIAHVTLLYRSNPFPPDNVAATAPAPPLNRVLLTWIERSHNENVFRVERRIPPGSFTFLVNAPRDAAGYTDLSVLANTTYCYRVRAEGDFFNVSNWTSEVCAATPYSADADGDGCLAWQEQAGAPAGMPGSTGAYNPNVWYDFYDVPAPVHNDPTPNGTRDKGVNVGDVVSVLKYAGTGLNCDPVGGKDYDSDKNGDTVPDGLEYDRSPGPPPNPPYDAGPPDGAVNATDVVLVLKQAGLGCQ